MNPKGVAGSPSTSPEKPISGETRHDTGEGPENLNSGESGPDTERNPEQLNSSETEPAFDGVDLHKLLNSQPKPVGNVMETTSGVARKGGLSVEQEELCENTSPNPSLGSNLMWVSGLSFQEDNKDDKDADSDAHSCLSLQRKMAAVTDSTMITGAPSAEGLSNFTSIEVDLSHNSEINMCSDAVIAKQSPVKKGTVPQRLITTTGATTLNTDQGKQNSLTTVKTDICHDEQSATNTRTVDQQKLMSTTGTTDVTMMVLQTVQHKQNPTIKRTSLRSKIKERNHSNRGRDA